MTRVERWRKRIENSPHGLWLIGAASYLESIIIPIPLEVVLIPYLMARRDRAWTIATVVTVGCLLGALTGYGVGAALLESIGQTWIEHLGWGSQMESFRSQFQEHGFWAIVGVGVVPVPFQVAMLVAGAAGYPLALFVLASAIARGIRYYGLAGLVVFFGERAQRLWDDHAQAVMLGLGTVCVALVALSYFGP
jgi:membrane protein YqaA with SNARE-associated domain